MGLGMYLSYRRNLDSIPETIQRVMRKQTFIDTWPLLAERLDKEDKLNIAIDQYIEEGTPYEERLMYWRKANAIHKFFVDNAAHGVDDCKPVQVTIDVLNNAAYSDDDESQNVILRAIDMGLPVQFPMLRQDDFKDYRAFLERTIEQVQPILKLDRLYPDPIVFRLAW